MHNIQAIIAPELLLIANPDLALPSKSIQLAQGYCLIPVTDAFHFAKTGLETPNVIESFEFLTPAFKNWLESISKYHPVAYIETDYFGGDGGQGAALFINGQCTLGPKFAPDGCINDALQKLGVAVGKGQDDEFHALDLGRHRSTARWLESAEGHE